MPIDTTSQNAAIRALTYNSFDHTAAMAESWTGGAGAPATVSYMFASGITQEEKDAALKGMAEWSSVSGITFQEATPEQQAARTKLDARLEETGEKFDATAEGCAQIEFKPASLPGDDFMDTANTHAADNEQRITGSTIRVDKDRLVKTGGVAPGSFGYMSAMHEIGHALGLSHPWDDGRNEDFNEGQTVMSYRHSAETDKALSKGKSLFPSKPMADDVAAAQYLYGPSSFSNVQREDPSQALSVDRGGMLSTTSPTAIQAQTGQAQTGNAPAANISPAIAAAVASAGQPADAPAEDEDEKKKKKSGLFDGAMDTAKSALFIVAMGFMGIIPKGLAMIAAFAVAAHSGISGLIDHFKHPEKDAAYPHAPDGSHEVPAQPQGRPVPIRESVVEKDPLASPAPDLPPVPPLLDHAVAIMQQGFSAAATREPMPIATDHPDLPGRNAGRQI